MQRVVGVSRSFSRSSVQCIDWAYLYDESGRVFSCSDTFLCMSFVSCLTPVGATLQQGTDAVCADPELNTGFGQLDFLFALP
jgi:hypothetical protein